MECTKIHSAHCTHHHPILPRNQAVYLFDTLIHRAKEVEFDPSYLMLDWDIVANRFNAHFEGNRIPGSSERVTKKSVGMLQCALVQNDEEFTRLYYEAERVFRAERREDWEEEEEEEEEECR
ncbi:MAG: hypothetical protein ALECFALPRED_000625 [Alectoria fallacina]|uniref:Uncharacterized protein n=1 Tax=Alectoria fallacina TaxID=1903189 RepID=A0A8H3EJ34_9LECA|nr:MAG: hypothetical protein ALECFALPRED_000625 [Alectoria fallacina]